jgi:hypothetical protein
MADPVSHSLEAVEYGITCDYAVEGQKHSSRSTDLAYNMCMPEEWCLLGCYAVWLL